MKRPEATEGLPKAKGWKHHCGNKQWRSPRCADFICLFFSTCGLDFLLCKVCGLYEREWIPAVLHDGRMDAEWMQIAEDQEGC